MTPGHNSVNPGQLTSIVQRIEKLAEEKAGIANDIKDIYAEAKGNGYEPAIIRELIRERKRDKADREERETLLALYRDAVGDAA